MLRSQNIRHVGRLLTWMPSCSWWTPRALLSTTDDGPPSNIPRTTFHPRAIMAEHLHIVGDDNDCHVIAADGQDLGVMSKSHAEHLALDRDQLLVEGKAHRSRVSHPNADVEAVNEEMPVFRLRERGTPHGWRVKGDYGAHFKNEKRERKIYEMKEKKEKHKKVKNLRISANSELYHAQYQLKNLVKWVEDGSVVRVQLYVKRATQSDKLMEYQSLIASTVGSHGTLVGLQDNLDGKLSVKLVVNPIETSKE